MGSGSTLEALRDDALYKSTYFTFLLFTISQKLVDSVFLVILVWESVKYICFECSWQVNKRC